MFENRNNKVSNYQFKSRRAFLSIDIYIYVKYTGFLAHIFLLQVFAFNVRLHDDQFA